MQPQTASVPLLRPAQVEDLKSELTRIEQIEQSPPFIKNQISDLPQMMRYKRDISAKIENEAPKPLRADEIDAAVSRERELREKMAADGMPTHAEMRRNPPGAVDKHRRWQERNKRNVQEWKNVRLRLAASGALADCPSESTDAASIERFRPWGGSGELNLDVAQIPGKTFIMPEKPQTVVLTDEEIELIRQVSPETADKLAFMSADGRQRLKDAVQRVSAEPETINSGTLERMGYHQAFRIAGHFKMGIAGGISKEDLYAAILAKHAGEPIPAL